MASHRRGFTLYRGDYTPKPTAGFWTVARSTVVCRQRGFSVGAGVWNQHGGIALASRFGQWAVRRSAWKQRVQPLVLGRGISMEASPIMRCLLAGSTYHHQRFADSFHAGRRTDHYPNLLQGVDGSLRDQLGVHNGGGRSDFRRCCARGGYTESRRVLR